MSRFRPGDLVVPTYGVGDLQVSTLFTTASEDSVGCGIVDLQTLCLVVANDQANHVLVVASHPRTGQTQLGWRTERTVKRVDERLGS